MNEASLKSLILCADDFSLNPAINAGILDLLAKNRLSAVSCMTQSPTWATDVKPLLLWKDQANPNMDIGLHFNLTQPFPNCYAVPLPLLMLQSSLRLLSPSKVRASFCSQLDAFESAFKSAPDFIDGHQHAHIFPVIRDIIIEEYLKRYGSKHHKPYMRSLENLPADTKNFKAYVLKCMGTQAHAHLLKKNNISCNTAFAGFYNFDPEENLDQRMKEWLSVLPTNSLIMCHPAHANHANDDEIAYARLSEYDYFSSEQFTQTLTKNSIQLSIFLN